ncbi:MAG: hypothetical protein ACYTEW_27180, partial [Planctomycetota bacterium]
IRRDKASSEGTPRKKLIACVSLFLFTTISFKTVVAHNGLRDEPPLVGGGNCACNFPCQSTERSEAATKGGGVGSIELIGGARAESYQLRSPIGRTVVGRASNSERSALSPGISGGRLKPR